MENFDKVLETMRKNDVETYIRYGLDHGEVVEVEKVIFPERGGVLTIYKDNEWLPAKGFKDIKSIVASDNVKKNIMVALYAAKTYWYLLPVLFLFRKKMPEVFINANWEIIKDILLKDKMYCDCVREIRRVFDKNNVPYKLKDLISVILEFDDAYRYRFQVAMEQLDKDNFKKSPTGELKRIMDVMSGLEKDQEVTLKYSTITLKNKWLTIKKVLTWLWLYRSVYGIMISIVEDIDQKRVIRSIEDIFHSKKKKNFKF